MKPIIITASILLLIYIGYRTYRIVNLAAGLDQKIAKGAIILDVRTQWEFETGHINGAINISLSQLRTHVIPFDTGKTIITCCSHGLRSVKAVSILHARGFTRVYNGGAWSDLNEIVQKAR
ncbi:rhodanese-like domain-containing protein [Mucilaginibacter flavus]|uniref:rhodanese-like domain-containing protein n=1 Tax=Mucilaginibacter flavus TaxID=931504 RepID=UPI0025B2D1F2|nr:rhodanese-like domain-containing protein [Mucilaginibacter flavus]MDN3584837.1 rhodanese-like domain-containing protein [Mucilaginibacter flavus]